MERKKSEDLEAIPGLVAAGIITREDAVKMLAQELYLSPYRFGLAAYDEDFRSEVILAFLRKAAPVLERYEPERSCFGGYLFAFVQGLILTQKRNEIRSLITDSSIKTVSCRRRICPGTAGGRHNARFLHRRTDTI